jgi:hypothetical protein
MTTVGPVLSRKSLPIMVSVGTELHVTYAWYTSRCTAAWGVPTPNAKTRTRIMMTRNIPKDILDFMDSSPKTRQKAKTEKIEVNARLEEA